MKFILFQAFHVCLKNGIQESFLCPNGTLFNQQFLVCDWWFHVTCSDAQKFYPINEYLQPPIRYRDGPVHPNVVPMSQNNLLTSTSKSSTTSLSHDLLPVEGNSNFTNNTEDASNFQSDDSDVFPRTKLLNVSDDPDWAKMGFQDMRNKFVSSLDKSNPPIGLPRHL